MEFRKLRTADWGVRLGGVGGGGVLVVDRTALRVAWGGVCLGGHEGFDHVRSGAVGWGGRRVLVESRTSH